MSKVAKRFGAAHVQKAPAKRPKRRRVIEEVPVDRRTVAGRIRICREAAGISEQATAARAISISAQSWGQLESGASKQPAADTLLDMRDKLGFDPDFVIRGKGMPLLPRFEELANEQALLSIFRELRPENRKTVLDLAQGIRRAQGGGPSPNDPYQFEPPKGDDD